MNLRGIKFHVDELGIDNEKVVEKLQKCVTDKGVERVIVQIKAVVSTNNIDCVIEGSTFDGYLTQPFAPNMEIVEDVSSVKGMTTSVFPVDADRSIVTEYMEIEPVTNWFGEAITGMFVVTDVSTLVTCEGQVALHN